MNNSQKAASLEIPIQLADNSTKVSLSPQWLITAIISFGSAL